MGCSFEVYSLIYKGTEVGCRVNLMVDGEAYCALDFREPAQKFASEKGIKGTLEVKEVHDEDSLYLLTEDEINGLVDVLDATENMSASEFISRLVKEGTSPSLGVFFYLCISNYIQRHDNVDVKLDLSTDYLLFRYKNIGYTIRYNNTLVEPNKHLVTVQREGKDARPLTYEIKEGTIATKQGFLRDCSRTVKLLQKEVLK